ncbi:MAG: hypothetical protein CMO80_10335 [Verrucomicrobiales bacterium]|nr:hypothetical protein [Verrucomicrobiales bacterium]|tara:strand:- start:4151 stop:5155 length:1005 start_codon:yes stop_codon:yes gene_type:complete
MKTTLCLLGTLLLLGFTSASAKPAPERAGFEQIFNLIKTNLAGVNADGLEREAIKGLLRRLQGDVQLLRKKQEVGRYEGELISEPRIVEDGIGYFRVKHVASGLAQAIHVSVESLNAPLSGLLVDLRFAGGADYKAAVAAANQFIDEGQTQVKIGSEHLSTHPNTNAISTSVTVLVNKETTGAAEVLAALLRENSVGLLIGNTTSGEMKVFTEIEVGDGSRLRIATDKVRLANGEEIPKLDPDITVEISADAEKAFFGDDIVARKKTTRKRLTEADLVHRLRLKNDPDSEIKAPKLPKVRDEIADPVLARALDLIKGLQALQPEAKKPAPKGEF